MISDHPKQLPPRREWLGDAALGASFTVLPAAVTVGATSERANAMPDIMHLYKIHASSDRVYEAITTADGIRQWWTRDAAIEPKIGAAGEFGFYAKRFVAKVTVEDLKPRSRVQWKVTNAAWPGLDIEFSLTTAGSDTNLLFAHRGFPQTDEGFASATTRWGFYLLSLKRYLETGRGTPNPDDKEGLG